LKSLDLRGEVPSDVTLGWLYEKMRCHAPSEIVVDPSEYLLVIALLSPENINAQRISSPLCRDARLKVGSYAR